MEILQIYDQHWCSGPSWSPSREALLGLLWGILALPYCIDIFNSVVVGQLSIDIERPWVYKIQLALHSGYRPVYDSVSVALLCRFHLDLVERNLWSGIISENYPERTYSSFHAAVRRIGESVDAEFGDHDIVSGTTHTSTSSSVVSLTEFPWLLAT